MKRILDPPVEASLFSPTLKKGSAELLILSLLENQQRHGYELAKLISQRSGERLIFQASSLYPVLFRMEKKGWIKGRWIDGEDVRRKRYYRLTTKGERALAQKRATWREFTRAINQVVDPRMA